MFTAKDMLYFVSPIPTTLAPADELFVTDTAYDRNSALAGTVVKLKAGMERLNGKMWKITEDGTFVAGHPIQRGYTYGRVVGLVEGRDDRFFFGTFRDETAQLGEVTDVLNSRAEYLIPSQEGSYENRVRLNMWLPAAPWAEGLMPRAGDTSATVAAKLELAKAKWQMNRAVLEMAHEGYQRGWTDDLTGLHENPDLSFLPRPRLGVIYEGEVLLTAPRGTRLDLSPEQREKITALEGKSFRGAHPVRAPRIPVAVSLPLNLQLDPEVHDLPGATVQVEREVRRVLADPEVGIGSHQLSYFVNGLAGDLV